MSDKKARVESLLRRGLENTSSLAELAALLRKAVRVLEDAEDIQYGCHCDLEEGMKPDGCVIPEGHPHDCIYAAGLLKEGETHWQCQYWKPVL